MWAPILNTQTRIDYSAVATRFHHSKSEWGPLTNDSVHFLEVTCPLLLSSSSSSSSYPLSVSYLDRIAQLLQGLQKGGIRNILFFGDSVMRQQWQVTEILLDILASSSSSSSALPSSKQQLQLHYIYAGNVIKEATTAHIKGLFQSADNNQSVVFANFGNASNRSIICVVEPMNYTLHPSSVA